MSWIMPFDEKYITGEYGTLSEYRRKRGMQPHSGTDWAPPGSSKGKTKIPAIAKGTIKLIQWSNILGWVIVQTAMDKDKKVWYLGYCHVKCGKHGVNCKGPKKSGCTSPIKKKVGHKLKAGDTVAFMGNTGIASSGVHLHATASRRLKGVFGVTADKADIKKLIKANSGSAKPAAKAEAPKPKPIEVPKPTSVAPRVIVPEFQKAEPTQAKHEAPQPYMPPSKPQVTFYKVQAGDSLSRIAAIHGTTVDKLVKDNNIANPNLIQVGQLIRIEK